MPYADALVGHQVAIPARTPDKAVRRLPLLRLGAGSHQGLPPPNLTVVLSLGPPTQLAAMPDPRQRPDEFDALVGGLHTRPATIGYEGQICGIELDMTPAGARSLLGLPAELTSSVIGLDYFISAASAELLERLNESARWSGCFAVLDRFLSALRPARAELEKARQLIVSSGGEMRVSTVANAVGWSRRHLQERFLAEFGISPKELARISRLDRSKWMLKRSPNANLAQVAAACGYYDQSHLAREWRGLAGYSPSRWIQTEELPLVPDDADVCQPFQAA